MPQINEFSWLNSSFLYFIFLMIYFFHYFDLPMISFKKSFLKLNYFSLIF